MEPTCPITKMARMSSPHRLETADVRFESAPLQWALRGHPHLWRAMADRLAGTPLLATRAGLEALLVATFNEVMGEDLLPQRGTVGAAPVYRGEFAHDGMSSGQVHVDTWVGTLIPLLVSRGVPPKSRATTLR